MMIFSQYNMRNEEYVVIKHIKTILCGKRGCEKHKADQDASTTRVLQKVLSLGSDYFIATFYQTFKVSPLY